MGNKVKTAQEYNALFPEGVVRDKALENALDIRKFEIELYWKRANYFWTLIAATFAGYFLLLDDLKNPNVNPELPFALFLITCIGLVLSLGWYLVNRGSKFWQENWERHVDALEDPVIGPLYRVVISKSEYCWLNFIGGYPYSVSKLNQMISLFITLIWSGLAYKTFPYKTVPTYENLDKYHYLAFLTLGFIILMLTPKGIFKSEEENQIERGINFRKDKLVGVGLGLDKKPEKNKKSGKPKKAAAKAALRLRPK